MAGPIIELKDVVKRYGALEAVAGVSLEIERGTFTALLGGSGSGKTTALKTINGLVVPTAGEVWVEGQRAPTDSGPGRVTGVGGIFFKSKHPKALAAWYRDVLGLTIEPWGGAMSALSHPASFGPMAMFSATVMCGKRPTSWNT